MRAKMTLRNVYHRDLPNVPFTYGVPVPESMAKLPADIALLDATGNGVPVSVQPMAVWPDKSIRWALLDFSGTFKPNETAQWQLAVGEGAKTPAPSSPVTVQEKPGEITLGNGPLRVVFHQKPFSLFHSLSADGVEIIRPGTRCDIVAVSPAGKVFRASLDPAPRLSVEDNTPNRTVIRWDGGLFAGDGTRLTEFRVKLNFFAGNPYIKIEHSVINREQPEKGVFLREYRIDFETAMERATEKILRQKNHGVDNFSRLAVLRQNVTILVPTEGQTPPNLAPGATGIFGTAGKCVIEDESAFLEDFGSFPHFLKPDAPRVMLGGGYSVVYPFLGIRDSARTAVVSFLRMCPQHPKAIRSDENNLRFDIWPAGAGNWRLCRGMTKTHHLALSFFGRSLSDEEIDNEAVRRECFTSAALHLSPHDPVTIALDPEYVRRTGQVEADRLLPYKPDLYPRIEAKIASLNLHGDPLALAGIMDYGEKIMTNNEEDQGHEYAMEYFRSGSYLNYCKLVSQMLHNSTVDVVCWDPDPLRMGGTPYHTGYHQDAVCVTSHIWTEGMFEYAYVSGDREAFRAAVGICDWILRWMEGKPHIVKQDGREIGWPIIALTAGYRATGDKRYLDAAYKLVDFYREKIAKWGELANNEPPGTGYHLSGYGEYAGFEGLHKLWLATKDDALRKFTLGILEEYILQKGHIQFTGHGRFMDMYSLYAAYDMSMDLKWIELAKTALPFVLSRTDWNGYFYRRIIHFLGLCHEHGLIDDRQVTLNQ